MVALFVACLPASHIPTKEGCLPLSEPRIVRSKGRSARKAKKLRRQRIKRHIVRGLICAGTLAVLALFAALGTIAVVIKGPSATASDILVISALETSAMKFVPRLFLSAGQIEAVRERNRIEQVDEDTDTQLVHIGDGDEQDEQPDIEVIDIKGKTFVGKMMLIKDPSRVTVGTCGNFGSAGRTLAQIAKRYEAEGALNGGAFVDKNGQGSGGIPDGIVVSKGKLVWEKVTDTYEVTTVIGFDEDDKLVFTQKMNAEQAKKLKLRDAVSFGPPLVHNGEPVKIKGVSSGMNPRSAIGQRADGTVLLLVVDGRKVNSMGATLADLVDVFIEYGAVNAANLDGGSSSYLFYDGKYQNVGSSLTGPRGMATAFIVK